MSWLVWKSVEERNAASVMLDILAGTKNKTAAEVAAEVVTEAARVSGLEVLYAVLAATSAGRAKVIVREDAAAREVWSRLWGDEFHRSVSKQWAEREVVQRRVARVGQERLVASTRVTELSSA